MSRLHGAVTAVVGPAFQRFLAELAPAERALAEAKPGFGGAFGNGKDALSRQVQHLLAQLGRAPKVSVQPSPEVCWYAGEAARRQSQEWCSGLMFLFAAGHFRRFAQVLVASNEAVLPKQRKATLAAAMRTACDPIEPVAPEQFAADLKARGVSDMSTRLAVKEYIAKGGVLDRPDRRDSTLTIAEAAALRDAFVPTYVTLASNQKVLFATCEFAETASGGLEIQRDIALTPLWHYLSSDGPSW